jgi:hypothetical protein
VAVDVDSKRMQHVHFLATRHHFLAMWAVIGSFFYGGLLD